MGLSDVEIDPNGYAMGVIPANAPGARTPIGFIAHVDTSPDVESRNIKPRLIEYGGGDIVLNEKRGIIMREDETLRRSIGSRIIVTDGTTLLGGDDKAGIAAIMAAAEYLMAHPEVKHGEIRLAFTPDEEIGRGMEFFDVKKFPVKLAYTVDGGALGGLEYETFNAAEAFITIRGRNTHPGYAKGVMVNSLQIAREIDSMIPSRERPENTEGRQGFFHLTEISGTVDEATMHYIIRDHDTALFKGRKQFMNDIAEQVNSLYPSRPVEISIKDQYYNMYSKIEECPESIDVAAEAMLELGITPVSKPVRGGTDGSRLSFMGIPTPNIFTGAENFHSRYEFVNVDVMESSSRLIVKIAELFLLKDLEGKEK